MMLEKQCSSSGGNVVIDNHAGVIKHGALRAAAYTPHSIIFKISDNMILTSAMANNIAMYARAVDRRFSDMDDVWAAYPQHDVMMDLTPLTHRKSWR